MRRALSEQAVLRAVIREIISEAPYQSSQRVQIQPVRFKAPSVKGLLIATGVAGLVGLYDWMADAFNCGQDNKRFPLVDTPKLFDEAMKAQAWRGDIESQYRTQFNPNAAAAADGKPAADITRAFSLYSSVVDAGGAVQAWPTSASQYAGLTPEAKKVVAGALLKTLSIYSNCPEAALQLKLYGAVDNYDKPPSELQTRAGYIKLLRDVVDNTHSTWVEGITEQRNALSVRFGGETTTVLTAFDNALKTEDRKYRDTVSKIK
jgi:hypothetical protein